MANRYFVFLYPDSRVVQELLDLAVFLLNPREKWQAHVTLAGPYPNRKHLPRKLGFARKVSLIGVGQFRSETQNTVFIKVGAEDLRDFWDKPDYPDFSPHLTLYDGDNSALADRLYSDLVEVRMFLKFYVTQVHIVQAVKGQGSLDLLSNINPAVLPELRSMTVSELSALPEQVRIGHAVEALKRAKFESSRL